MFSYVFWVQVIPRFSLLGFPPRCSSPRLATPSGGGSWARAAAWEGTPPPGTAPGDFEAPVKNGAFFWALQPVKKTKKFQEDWELVQLVGYDFWSGKNWMLEKLREACKQQLGDLRVKDVHHLPIKCANMCKQWAIQPAKIWQLKQEIKRIFFIVHPILHKVELRLCLI